ncbi:porin [Bradyrhizobium sp. USDA 4353]
MCRSFSLGILAILGIIAWLAVALPASAGSSGASLLTSNAAGGSKPPTRPTVVNRNPCASYGANFVRVEGTDTCVKVGGALRLETGTSLGR